MNKSKLLFPKYLLLIRRLATVTKAHFWQARYLISATGVTKLGHRVEIS